LANFIETQLGYGVAKFLILLCILMVSLAAAVV